jgi:hypothetical protein
MGVRLLAALLVTCGAALLPAPALAQDPLPDDNSGTDQYIEPVPDAGGDRPARGGSDSRPGRLPPGTREALPPGEEGQTLGRIATDPGAGAPVGGGSDAGGGSGSDSGAAGGADGGNGGGGRSGSGAAADADPKTGLASALGSAVVDSDSPALPLLLLAVVGMTVVALLVRFGRRS